MYAVKASTDPKNTRYAIATHDCQGISGMGIAVPDI
jgi:hypothetical protein